MFAHQQFDYKAKYIQTEQEAMEILENIPETIDRLGFDTETTGLNIITDTPFLLVVGWDKQVYAMEPYDWAIDFVVDLMIRSRHVFAHNATFDYHMLFNTGRVVEGILRKINWADSMAVARLTQYADVTTRLSLEALGKEYVLTSAKEASTVIRAKMAELNKSTKKFLKEWFQKTFPDRDFEEDFKTYISYVQYTELGLPEDVFLFFYANYSEANYESVFHDSPNIMVNYAMDDVVIMLEYLNKAMPTLDVTDPNHVTFNRECKLIHATVWMERKGIKIDIPYMLSCRNKVMKYRDELQDKLSALIYPYEFKHSQSKVIIEYFDDVYGIKLDSADELSLSNLKKHPDMTDFGKETVDVILELRSVENKVLSTYIDGKLNEIHEGRIYPRINNQGAVSGRMSCSMQQQPKDALVRSDTGEELFHPRKAFIADEGTTLVFMDYNQMELRIQANYTILLGFPDVNLCRAYIPFGCTNEEGKVFDFSKGAINTGEFKLSDGKLWEALDLHAVTTFKAFPHLNNDPNHPEFKHYRRLGKMCNFLKNYQGGVGAIKEQLGVSDEIAEQLDKAYYEAFPNVKEYQKWVQKQMLYYNHVTNLMGRRYYMNDSRWFYKAGNYLVQGTAADLFKEKVIILDNFLYGFETQMVLPVHDELLMIVPDDEMWLVPQIHAKLEQTQEFINHIPMTVGVDISKTNWADKEEYM